MRLTLNGNDHAMPEDNTITGLLVAVGLGDKPVVVEHNKVALFPRDFTTTKLTDGDSVEIITIAAGG
jgi:thiamine biosynthesis protein ThiS